ncbi:MAG TPA: hypothetical protein VL221_10900 [Bacteroidota bacterium]|nr:hypothetical protein [Bacteroidota bacterium]
MSISRREFIKGASSVLISGAVAPLWPATEPPLQLPGGGGGPEARPASFTLESYAAYSANYLESLVDANGLPYFNVFWTQPAEAAHDWPDFGDVMSRQWQGAVMLRRMTGREAATENIWRKNVLSLIDASDGLLHRPATSYSKAIADWGDASLTLYALVTAAVASGDELLKKAAVSMAEGMLSGLRSGRFQANSFAIKSLMVAARLLGCEAGLEAARILVDRTIVHGRTFTPDNTYGPSGHMHGNLRTMVGAADYALTVGDPVLFSRIDALYRYVKTTGTSFGFLPEAVGRKGDIIACETCALMDFAGVGVTLANHGHTEYWGDMERLARNHYVESQVRDTSWLVSDNARADTPQFTYHDIDRRILGAWAGWSAPNHILACRETLNAHWGGPELKNKVRALQNCCGGSGLHGLFILWKNAARFEDGTLSVNMHIDKKLPQAEIRCEQPYRGFLRIAMKVDGGMRVRIPEFTGAAGMNVRVNGAAPTKPATQFGNYLELKDLHGGDLIEVAYPLPLRTEDVVIGNPGFRQWRYRATWKGDTVVRMEPVENDQEAAYSEFEKANVGVYYGRTGPGQLYMRDAMLRDVEPTEAGIYPDDGGLDFWKIK